MSRRYLLDTNAAADCIFGRRGMLERVNFFRRGGAKIGIGIPVLAELLAGIEFSKSRDKNLKIVSRKLNLFRIWPFTPSAARTYGQIFATLRQSGGRLIQTNDIMIAAIAINLGKCTVVSHDSDFAVVHGLTIEDWAE